MRWLAWDVIFMHESEIGDLVEYHFIIWCLLSDNKTLFLLLVMKWLMFYFVMVRFSHTFHSHVTCAGVITYTYDCPSANEAILKISGLPEESQNDGCWWPDTKLVWGHLQPSGWFQPFSTSQERPNIMLSKHWPTVIFTYIRYTFLHI